VEADVVCEDDMEEGRYFGSAAERLLVDEAAQRRVLPAKSATWAAWTYSR
jgi:hypothetical protein